MVSQSGHRPECLAAPTLDAHALRFARLRRPQVYSRAIQVFIRLPLARAYALTGDERFPQAFWSAIEDWARHSPPMSGPLWICGQECSLRILAWTFALHAFIRSPSTTPSASHCWSP